MSVYLKILIKRLTHIHIDKNVQNIIIFSAPRSGSTWLMEILATEKGSKIINEPLNLRNPLVMRFSGMKKWEDNIDLKKSDNLILYINSLIRGRLSFKNPAPTSSYFRAITDHSVVKILHGGENMIDDILQKTNSKGIFLVRHPIPVALSRKQLPRLESFIFSGKFGITQDKLNFAKKLFEKGDFFEKAVLDWCFQNYFPLKENSEFFNVISYEDLVLKPEPIIKMFYENKMISDISKAVWQLEKPSKTTYQSSDERKKLIESDKRSLKKEIIISKWMDNVDETNINNAQRILDVFEIDYYKADSFYPLR